MIKSDQIKNVQGYCVMKNSIFFNLRNLARTVFTGLALVCIFNTNSLSARETDQYITWNIEIADSSEKIDQYLQQQMERVLASKKAKKQSCVQISKAFFHKLVGTFTFSQLSLYAQDSEEMAEFRFPGASVGKYEYVGQSIFAGSGASPIIRWLIGLAPNLNVNGIYFGTDKLGHISYMGDKYFKKYLKLRKRGMNHEETIIKILNEGIKSELMLGGLYGTSSPSDLEANYQGLRLALDLCQGESPILTLGEQGWSYSKEKMSIRNYVTPHFDESFYPIVYGKRTWNKSAKNRILKICQGQSLDIVKKRFAYYRSNFKPSLNIEVLAAAMTKDKSLSNSKYSADQVCGIPLSFE